MNESRISNEKWTDPDSYFNTLNNWNNEITSLQKEVLIDIFFYHKFPLHYTSNLFYILLFVIFFTTTVFYYRQTLNLKKNLCPEHIYY